MLSARPAASCSKVATCGGTNAGARSSRRSVGIAGGCQNDGPRSVEMTAVGWHALKGRDSRPRPFRACHPSDNWLSLRRVAEALGGAPEAERGVGNEIHLLTVGADVPAVAEPVGR